MPDRPIAPDGGPVSAARQRILDTASRRFYADGIVAVGVDRIIADAGVAKATFYRWFPSKDDLVVAYLDRSDGGWMAQLRAAAADAGPEPSDQLLGLFDAVSRACRTDGYRGCAFINAAAESPPGSAAHDRVLQHKRRVRDWIEHLAAEAGFAEPATVARSLAVLLDGSLTDAALEAGPEVAAATRAAAQAILDTAPRTD